MDEATRSRILGKIQKRLEPYVQRLKKNILRVKGLLDLHASEAVRDLTPETRDDILRSAVVFLHATLEQFLRQLASSFLPLADEQALNEVPLIGMAGRPEKFFLGKLRGHRQKSVQSLIEESVSAHLEKSNFNNVGEIKRLLASIGISIEDVDDHVTMLGRMMERRHQIVHRADNLEKGQGLTASKPVDPEEVRQWISALQSFLLKIPEEATLRHLIDDGHVTFDEQKNVYVHHDDNVDDKSA